jgi:hypothetical protein
VPLYLVHHESHVDGAGVETGRPRERPATNRLDYGSVNMQKLKIQSLPHSKQDASLL